MLKEIAIKYRRLLIVLLHFVLIGASYIAAYYCRFEFTIPDTYVKVILNTFLVVVVIKMTVFYFLGVFHSSLRYASIFDLWQLVKANTYSSMTFAVAIYFMYAHRIVIPRSVFVMDWLFCLGTTSGIRFASRFIRERFAARTLRTYKKALIIGAGAAGNMVLREYRSNPSARVKIVGFIDDDRSKRNMRIQGIPVMGSREMIPQLSQKLGITELIIAIPSARGEQIRDIISYCHIPDVKIKIVPGLHKILTGELEIKPRDIKPEDLLGRESVRINESEVRSYIKDKRVMVTGAAGSIGSELCRQIARFSPRQVILFDYNENDMYFLERELSVKYPAITLCPIVGDVRDVGLLKHSFSRARPQIVFHAAAFKHVPLMERNPSAAIKNNVISTRNLIYASEHYGVESFVFISSDKAVNPTSVMGAAKRLGEMIIQAKAKAKKSKTKLMAVRFGNVLGSKGSVVPLFRKQIEEQGCVTVTHPEARRFFMSTKEAVELVIQAASIGKGGEIFILDMGEPIKIVDLARDLITLSGLKPDKDIPIEFIGLRPGEKLHEELLLNIEKDKATKHNKIYVTQPNDFDPRRLRIQVKELEHLAHIMAEEKIIDKIKEILPAYYPQDASGVAGVS